MKQQGTGTIINISSVPGIPFRFMPSTAPQNSHECLRQKRPRWNSRAPASMFLTVCPGYVRTDFSANAIRGREAKTVRPSAVRGISVERVARAVPPLREGEAGGSRALTMHPAIKIYQLFPGLVERTMVKMARRVE